MTACNEKKEKDEFTDITIDWNRNEGSYKHILSSVMDEVVNIFSSIGYEVAYGPEAETSWHNFDALNTPDWHPARYESDTIYLNSDLETLLRTQTSTVQIRHMEQNDPPVYIVAPGRVFRSDQLDATHSPVFHQLEGLAIDKNLSFTDLKGTLKFLENIDIFTLAESLGGVESLIEHPAIMTHASIEKNIREDLGISDSLVRLSIGIEDPEDLKTALNKALDLI
jgi:phenylalanyl-tRNA synthetase alpha subunit